jgi:hypothetical protein
VPGQGNSFDCGVRVLHAISEIVNMDASAKVADIEKKVSIFPS